MEEEKKEARKLKMTRNRLMQLDLDHSKGRPQGHSCPCGQQPRAHHYLPTSSSCGAVSPSACPCRPLTHP